MFPQSNSGPVWLHAWVKVNGISFEAQIVDASADTQTAQIIRLGTLFEQTVQFSNLEAVALYEGTRVLKAFGRPYIGTKSPEWVAHAEVL